MSDKQVSMADLLNGTLDDLEDLPELRPFPPGLHKVITTMEQKAINNKQCLVLNFTYVEPLELNPEYTPPKQGDKSNIMFQLDNETARGFLKRVLVAAAEKFGAKSNGALIEDMKNAEAAIVTRIRRPKDWKEGDAEFLQLDGIRFL